MVFNVFGADATFLVPWWVGGVAGVDTQPCPPPSKESEVTGGFSKKMELVSK